MKDKQLEALIRKATAKANEEKAKAARFEDPTLAATRGGKERNDETDQLFKEMKRREF